MPDRGELFYPGQAIIDFYGQEITIRGKWVENQS
jgi:hypothetical protein